MNKKKEIVRVGVRVRVRVCMCVYEWGWKGRKKELWNFFNNNSGRGIELVEMWYRNQARKDAALDEVHGDRLVWGPALHNLAEFDQIQLPLADGINIWRNVAEVDRKVEEGFKKFGSTEGRRGWRGRRRTVTGFVECQD